MKDLISVIVPVYNAEKYLKKCVESIRNQTYKNFELILIDDGSTDATREICDLFEAADARVFVVHVKNGGAGKARNIGLSYARGKYISFVDSDDYIDERCLEILYNDIKQHHVMAAFVQVKWISKEIEYSNRKRGIAKLYNKDEFMQEFLNQKILNWSVCGALYDKTVFDKILFPEDRFSEDMWVKFFLMTHLRKIVIDETELYYYVIHKGSKMTSDFRMEKLDKLEVYKKQAVYVRHNYPELYDKAKEQYYVNLFDITGSMVAAGKFDHSKIQRKMLAKIRKHFGEIFQSTHLVWKAQILLVALCIHPKMYRMVMKMRK